MQIVAIIILAICFGVLVWEMIKIINDN